jgi:hypothetical protein
MAQNSGRCVIKVFVEALNEDRWLECCINRYKQVFYEAAGGISASEGVRIVYLKGNFRDGFVLLKKDTDILIKSGGKTTLLLDIMSR